MVASGLTFHVNARPSTVQARMNSFPLFKKSSSQRRLSLCVVAADLPVATDTPTTASRAVSDALAVRKFLLSAGLQLDWVDGIVSEMKRYTLSTNVAKCEAALSYLQSLGIKLHNVENMISICKRILACDVEDIKAVVEWLRGQGIGESAVIDLLEANPVLLTMRPSADGPWLEKGPSRAEITYDERGGRKVVGVMLYREGAAFGKSPIAPILPKKR